MENAAASTKAGVDCVEDGGGVGVFLELPRPEQVALEALPPEGPSSVLSTDVIEVLVDGVNALVLSIVHLANSALADQHDVLDLFRLKRKHIIVILKQD